MAEQWYYWHESEVLGPFSGQQLVDLATAGSIVPDDIVWKEGVERGIPAHKVQHLFVGAPLPAAAAVASEAVPAAAAEGKGADGSQAKAVGPAEESVKSTWDRGRAASSGKARAVAGKGTVIVGQDGKTVKFRMKCTVCGFEDSSWQNMNITRGVTRKVFYCPKCRKRCNVEIHGHVG
jgi:hypothetical protein